MIRAENILIVLVACVFGVLRVYGEHGDIFKDAAHLFVGFLIGGAVYVGREQRDQRRFLVVTAVVLSLVELSVAILRR